MTTIELDIQKLNKSELQKYIRELKNTEGKLERKIQYTDRKINRLKSLKNKLENGLNETKRELKIQRQLRKKQKIITISDESD